MIAAVLDFPAIGVYECWVEQEDDNLYTPLASSAGLDIGFTWHCYRHVQLWAG